MTVALPEQYLNRADNEARIAVVSQRSGRMLAVGAKRIPAWGGPLATLAIAILATLAIKYLKRFIGTGSSDGRAAFTIQGLKHIADYFRFGRSGVRLLPGPRKQIPSTKGVVTITETPTTPEAVAPATDNKEEDKETMFRRLAERQWKALVRVTTAEIKHQRGLGNITSLEVTDLYGILGVPQKPSKTDVTVSFEHTHRLQVNANETKEQFLARVNREPAEYLFYSGVKVSTKATDVTDWPEDTQEPDPLEGLTAAQIIAKVESTRAALREWARALHQDRGKWCNTSAVNEVLAKVDLEPLPTPKTFIVKIPVTGETEYRVTALDAKAALKKVREDYGVDESGKYDGSLHFKGALDLSKAVGAERVNKR